MPIALEINEKGDGIMDTITKYAHKITKLLPSSDNTYREGWEDERHGVLKLKNGKYGRANYMGPGTHLVERIKRGDPPRTAMDELSRAHDIRYTNAKKQSDISRADEIFIKGAKKIEKEGLDHDINIQLGLRPIQAKYYYEKVRNPNYEPEEQPSSEDQKLLDVVLRDAISKGYGVRGGDLFNLQNNNSFNEYVNFLHNLNVVYSNPIGQQRHNARNLIYVRFPNGRTIVSNVGNNIGLKNQILQKIYELQNVGGMYGGVLYDLNNNLYNQVCNVLADPIYDFNDDVFEGARQLNVNDDNRIIFRNTQNGHMKYCDLNELNMEKRNQMMGALDNLIQDFHF